MAIGIREKTVDPQEKERISNQYNKTSLSEWKEIIVLLNAIMVWEKNWYPVITITSVTCLYLYVWLVNCSILNLVWAGCLCATLLDCFVSGPFRRALPPNCWNRDKERTYSAIIEFTADCYLTIRLCVERFVRLRQTNTGLFHSVLLVTFFSLLCVGTTFNHLFISYVTVLVILLSPGFKIKSEYIEDSLKRHAYLMVSYLWSSENNTVSS